MDEHPKEPGKLVVCHRLNVARTPEEHLGCVYCFGKKAAIAQGDHAQFCDYQPGTDPICFGFPEESERLQHG